MSNLYSKVLSYFILFFTFYSLILWKKITEFQNPKIKGILTSRKTMLGLVGPRLKNAVRQKMKQFMSSTTYMLFMSVLTIYTIFAIDIDKGFFNHDASIFFSTVHVISMFIFVFEIIVTCFVEKDYFLQFYFWIDIFSTLMMTLQLIWIQDLMNSTDNIQVAISFARVSKASRFSKIGARSTKIMKLIRLIKLMKLFRNKQTEAKQELRMEQNNENENEISEKQQEQNSENGTISSNHKFIKRFFERPHVNPLEQQKIQIQWEQLSMKQRNKYEQKPKQENNKGTKVGEILKYEIQKNIVIMVMGLIMIVPLLSASTWFNKTADMEPSTQSYVQTLQNQTNSDFLNSWLQSFVEVSLNSSRPMVKFGFKTFQFPTDQNYLASLNITSLTELRSSQETVIQDTSFSVFYSKKTETQITSWINIARSFLIIVLLLLTSIMFVKDLEIYALNPLQKMSTTVSKIEKNPFSVLQNDDQENEQELVMQKESEQLELQTNILENFFIKITSFLALGVGETPLRSTSTSIQRIEEKKNIFSELNCVKVEGIFVCIQLSNIQQLNNYLEDKASSFVNSIMQIFHKTVIENGGFVFHQDEEYSLVCWKFLGQLEKPTLKNIQVKYEQRKNAQLAFLSYLRFIDKLGQNQLIKKYKKQHELATNISQAAEFHVGFHTGIAYCGAIGSQFKLSLKAMGPDISITKSLCRAAKKYKIGNLMSEKFMKIAPFASLVSRKIEQFRYVQAHRMGTIEVFSSLSTSSLRALIKAENNFNQSSQQVKENQQQRQRKKIQIMFKFREEMLKAWLKNKSEDLCHLSKSFLKKYPNVEEYLELWRESCAYYEQGQWGNAKIGFQNSKQCNIIVNDVTTDLRLTEIGNREDPPSNWDRHRKISLFL